METLKVRDFNLLNPFVSNFHVFKFVAFFVFRVHFVRVVVVVQDFPIGAERLMLFARLDRQGAQFTSSPPDQIVNALDKDLTT